MAYKKEFDPATQDHAPAAPPTRKLGDRRDGEVHICNSETELAVNVALATGRPLLIFGPPGSGKSSLAPFVARCLNWRYYPAVISSTMQARDLQWSFDTIRRLNDAQPNATLKPMASYIEPGVLWWAFNRDLAMRRGLKEDRARTAGVAPPVEPGVWEKRDPTRAVVLLDEIDKADPDVPNNLLVPIGSHQFAVDELGIAVEAEHPPLVLITTNDERELPKAFLRRCVVLSLSPPDLVPVAEKHFGNEGTRALYEAVAERVAEIAKENKAKRLPEPSTAEYLDAVSACVNLGITPQSPEWVFVATAALSKRSAEREKAR